MRILFLTKASSFMYWQRMTLSDRQQGIWLLNCFVFCEYLGSTSSSLDPNIPIYATCAESDVTFVY